MDTSSIARRLRSERIRTGLTQAEIADRLKLPHVTYRSYESGRSMPPLSFYERMLSAQLDASYVATGKPAMMRASEHAGALARKLRMQKISTNDPRTLDEALLLLKKLMNQSEGDESSYAHLSGKRGGRQP